MLVLAINGSLRGTASNTDLILQPVLKGMASAGATTETIYLNNLKINTVLVVLIVGLKRQANAFIVTLGAIVRKTSCG